ncbi:MAG: hypothetical protein AB1422_08580 [bacterium]
MLLNDVINHYLPWWFNCIATLKILIENIITHWITLRDIFFIALGILVGIFIYRVRLRKDSLTTIEKNILKSGEILKLIYNTILNLIIKPLIICAIFIGLFITLIGSYALISISYRVFGFFIPTLAIIISVVVTIIIIITKGEKEKKSLSKKFFDLVKDIFF